MVRFVMVCILVTLVPVEVTSYGAQEKDQLPTAEQIMLRSWKSIHRRLIEMAKDFPEDKFDYRPHPDARSFLEEIWHVTAVARVTAAQIKGEDPPDDAFSLAGKPRTRPKLVAALEEAAAEVADLLEKNNYPLIINLNVHAGEHYGKLVTIYRVNGLVPPTTRAALERQRKRREEREKKKQE